MSKSEMIFVTINLSFSFSSFRLRRSISLKFDWKLLTFEVIRMTWGY